jgi:hypothetical protein
MMSNGNDDDKQPTIGPSNDLTANSPQRLRNTTETARPRPRFVSFLYLMALWTLPGLLYSVQIYQLGLRQTTPSATFFAAMLHALPVW